ncbi:MAG: hypothetical protein OEY10_00045 [Nitrosopumilus sp.]|nr:hypothetical protein [Nitrosopumilus sp.]
MKTKQLVKKTFTGYIAKNTVMEDSVTVDAEDLEHAIFIDHMYTGQLSKSEEEFWHPDELPVRKINVTLIIEEEDV